MGQNKKRNQDVQENEKRKSDIKFASIFEKVPGNHLILQPNPPDFTLIAVSDNYNSVTLTSREEILGRSLFDVFPDNPNDPNATGVRNLTDSLMTVLATKKEHRMNIQKYDVPRPDNSGFEEKYWSPVNTPVLDKNGILKYIIHTVVDVTELVKLQEMEKLARELADISTERLYSVFNQAPVAIAMFSGPDNIVRFANQLHLDIWDRRLDEVINKPLFEALPELVELGYDQILKDVYTTGHPYFANEHSVLLKSKGKVQRLYFNIAYQPLRNSNGVITGVITTATEVTELIESRNKIREFTQSLLQANQELEQFAYSASHDLREPLRKIQMFADMILTREEHSLSDSGKKTLNKIGQTAEKMSGLIADLMAYAKNSRHSKTLERIDLNEVLQNVKNDLEVKIKETHARITSDNLPTIEAIPFQIHQLFLNILGNSLKFIKPGESPDITITFKRIGLQDSVNDPNLNPGKEYVQLQFIDKGVGFEQNYANQVFFPFKRVHHQRDFAGNGVGLAICKKIVMNHKGTIQADSKPDEGTTITVTLPVN
jgi:signal transduction histidine kinase